MKTRFLMAALQELEEAAGHYDKSKPGLGDELYEEIGAALTSFPSFPKPRPERNGARAATTSNDFLIILFTG